MPRAASESRLKAVSEGKVAGHSAIGIIERTPKIDIEAEGVKMDFKGQIQFKDVKFNYPSRTE
jgi:hypothetical protein